MITFLFEMNKLSKLCWHDHNYKFHQILEKQQKYYFDLSVYN